jgi:hypothetical protein
MKKTIIIWIIFIVLLGLGVYATYQDGYNAGLNNQQAYDTQYWEAYNQSSSAARVKPFLDLIPCVLKNGMTVTTDTDLAENIGYEMRCPKNATSDVMVITPLP